MIPELFAARELAALLADDKTQCRSRDDLLTLSNVEMEQVSGGGSDLTVSGLTVSGLTVSGQSVLPGRKIMFSPSPLDFKSG